MTEEDSEKENSGLHTPPTPYLLSLVVSQGDALGWHLEVYHRGHRRRLLNQGHTQGFLDRLVTSEGLHFHRVQVPHIAGCKTMRRGWEVHPSGLLETHMLQCMGRDQPEEERTRSSFNVWPRPGALANTRSLLSSIKQTLAPVPSREYNKLLRAACWWEKYCMHTGSFLAPARGKTAALSLQCKLGVTARGSEILKFRECTE